MLKIPVYARNGVYYFHSRINQHQVKRSLNTKDPNIAMIRALDLLQVIDMTIDLNKIKKYEIDLQPGVFKADSPENHKNLMEFMDSNIDKIGIFKKTPAPSLRRGSP